MGIEVVPAVVVTWTLMALLFGLNKKTLAGVSREAELTGLKYSLPQVSLGKRLNQRLSYVAPTSPVMRWA